MNSDIAWQEICTGRLLIKSVNGVQVGSCYEDSPGKRVQEGLQVLYTFEEGQGTVVHDTSGVGTPLDLQADHGAAVDWIPGGGLKVKQPTLISSAGPALPAWVA